MDSIENFIDNYEEEEQEQDYSEEEIELILKELDIDVNEYADIEDYIPMLIRHRSSR